MKSRSSKFIFGMILLASSIYGFQFNYFNNPACMNYALQIFQTYGIRDDVKTALTNTIRTYNNIVTNEKICQTSSGWIETSVDQYFDTLQFKVNIPLRDRISVLNCYMTAFLLTYQFMSCSQYVPTDSEAGAQNHFKYMTDAVMKNPELLGKEDLYKALCANLKWTPGVPKNVMSVNKNYTHLWELENMQYPTNGISYIQVVNALGAPFIDHVAVVFHYNSDYVMIESQTWKGPYMIARFKTQLELYQYFLEYFERNLDSNRKDIQWFDDPMIMIYDNGNLVKYKQY